MATSNISNVRALLDSIRARNAIEKMETVLAPVSRANYVPNLQQMQAIELAKQGKSFCLIGKAGTGKTSTVRAIIESLSVGLITNSSKVLRTGTPSVAGVAFTNRAAKNLRKQFPVEYRHHITTIHNLTEFEPVDIDGPNGSTKQFRPTRTMMRKLPFIKVLFIEEASQISVDLHKILMDAMPDGAQVIYLGDLAQLKPVMGYSILGFKLCELPVIELTQIYRQKEGSPIIDFAHRISQGDPIPYSTWDNIAVPGQLELKKMPVGAKLAACRAFSNFMYAEFVAGRYDFEKHAVLIPFKKDGTFGVNEFNRMIAEKIDVALGRTTVCVRHKRGNLVLAVGDKVLVGTREGFVTGIDFNNAFNGDYDNNAKYNRAGKRIDDGVKFSDALDIDAPDLDALLAGLEFGDGEDMDSASHIVTVSYFDGDDENVAEVEKLSSHTDIAKLTLAYAMTIYQAQGLQWPTVYIAFHTSHGVQCTRESIYTAVTRAENRVCLVCMASTLVDGVLRASVPGKTWQEKAEFFKGKMEEVQEDFEETSLVDEVKAEIKGMNTAIRSLRHE